MNMSFFDRHWLVNYISTCNPKKLIKRPKMLKIYSHCKHMNGFKTEVTDWDIIMPAQISSHAYEKIIAEDPDMNIKDVIIIATQYCIDFREYDKEFIPTLLVIDAQFEAIQKGFSNGDLRCWSSVADIYRTLFMWSCSSLKENNVPIKRLVDPCSQLPESQEYDNSISQISTLASEMDESFLKMFEKDEEESKYISNEVPCLMTSPIPNSLEVFTSNLNRFSQQCNLVQFGEGKESQDKTVINNLFDASLTDEMIIQHVDSSPLHNEDNLTQLNPNKLPLVDNISILNDTLKPSPKITSENIPCKLSQLNDVGKVNANKCIYDIKDQLNQNKKQDIQYNQNYTGNNYNTSNSSNDLRCHVYLIINSSKPVVDKTHINKNMKFIANNTIHQHENESIMNENTDGVNEVSNMIEILNDIEKPTVKNVMDYTKHCLPENIELEALQNKIKKKYLHENIQLEDLKNKIILNRLDILSGKIKDPEVRPEKVLNIYNWLKCIESKIKGKNRHAVDDESDTNNDFICPTYTDKKHISKKFSSDLEKDKDTISAKISIIKSKLFKETSESSIIGFSLDETEGGTRKSKNIKEDKLRELMEKNFYKKEDQTVDLNDSQYQRDLFNGCFNPVYSDKLLHLVGNYFLDLNNKEKKN